MSFKTSRAGRFNKILSIGAKVLGESVSGALKARDELQVRINQARAVADGLAELKGASMKLGQWISMQGESFLPPEVVEVLSKLQNAAPAFSGDEIVGIARAELGEKWDLLRDFDPQPIGAASIGQVHRARLATTGEELALKIQYPGVGSAIDSEVALLKTILTPFTKLWVGRIDLDEIVDELKFILRQETDYEKEASFLEFFRVGLKSDERFIVPQVFREVSTQKVLSMSFEPGLALKTFMKTNPSLRVRNQIGEAVYELLLRELFEFKTVQTDPNFANYLFRASSVSEAVEIVLLDFGACKTFSPEFIEKYRLFGLAILQENRKALFELAYELHFISPNESQEVHELFYEMGRMSVEPILGDVPFDYAKSDLPRRMQELGTRFVMKLRSTPPPREILFLNRKLGGMYQMLRVLGVVANFRNLNEKFWGNKI